MVRIGTFTKGPKVKIQKDGKLLSDINADSLVLGGDAPVYKRETAKPSYFAETQVSNEELKSKYGTTDSNKEMFLQLLQTPTIASKRWVFEQYDSQVRTNTVSIKGDAAILRLKELPGKGIAVATDCNSRYVYLNPYEGGKAAVAEAARNVACTGAKPVAITNCLNFGNPYDPEVYYQFSEAIRGMGDMCRTLDTPVTGGNVSFHNESKQNAVFPTPTIGMLGIIDDFDKTCGAGFSNMGDKVAVLGGIGDNLSGSEYLKAKTGKILGVGQFIDLEKEKNLQSVILDIIHSGLVNSAHDTAEGGLAIAIAESCMIKGLGFESNRNFNTVDLFNESQGRIIVSYNNSNETRINEIADKFNVEFQEIGEVKSDKFRIGNIMSDLEEITSVYENAISNIMSK
ncbi:MAG: hypothetical protein Kapaf2KO_22990 [Candidatus Kapaibacteriales bacterium]